jgi:peptidoglycan/xylan/chitin deacetylase (PgdA/CDA1 family)
MALKHKLIEAGFAVFRLSGLHRAVAPLTRGCGVILTFHRVRPFAPPTPGYAPNRLLELEPDFFDAALTLVRRLGFEFVSLAEARRRLVEGGSRFAAVTFDDGYRDTRDFALPILEKHLAPATVFFATGFLDRSARLWWLELEEALRRLDVATVEIDGRAVAVEARTPAEKTAAFERIYWALRARPEAELLAATGALAAAAGVSSAEIADQLFMDWDEAAAFAQRPLVAAGAHSRAHRMLAKWPEADARAEMAGSKAALERRFGRAVDAFAYPVGDPTSAGPREFALARQAGFACAVTTRPGMLYAEHAAHLWALPRVSVNGLWQSLGDLESLLSGAPLLLWNRGRRINVG